MIRHFRDRAGVEWRVCVTERSEGSARRDQYLPEAYRAGWLLFESAIEKRRLAPFPADWAALSDKELEALHAAAAPQARSRGKQGENKPVDVAPPAVADKDPLRPELRKVEEQLEKTIEQVCEAPKVEKLDTGQLIRVEETLAIASEAAKEAISLRRRLHANRQNVDRGEENHP